MTEHSEPPNPYGTGCGLPNAWGWLAILVMNALVAAVIIGLLSLCQGCAVTSSYSADGPSGTVTSGSASYAGGLVRDSYSESSSRDQYRECMEDRERMRRTWSSEFVDDQATCFAQTTSGRPLTTGPMPFWGWGGWGAPYAPMVPFSPTGGAAGVR